MAVSVFDLFSIGIGPSSSHTVGPMRAAHTFAKRLEREGLLPATTRVLAELFGSLGATGHGHGTPKAVLLGLEGHRPADVDVRAVDADLARIRDTGRLWLLAAEHKDAYPIEFDQDRDLLLHRRQALPYHPNGLQLSAFGADGGQPAQVHDACHIVTFLRTASGVLLPGGFGRRSPTTASSASSGSYYLHPELGFERIGESSPTFVYRGHDVR